MKIVAAEIHEIEIPLKLSFKHSLAAHKSVKSVVLRLENDHGISGYGECVPRSYVTGETVQSVVASLRDRKLPGYMGIEFASFQDILACLEAELANLERVSNAAHCALELALLDLAGKEFGCSAGSVLGPILLQEARYSAVVSAENPDQVRSLCTLYAGYGVTSLKLKVGQDRTTDLQNLKIARDVMGETCQIRIDANTAWSAEEALARIQEMQPYRLDGVEQPVPAVDMDGLAWLTSQSSVPIMVDESLASFEDAQELVARKACHYFNIRISKCGGLLNARRIRDFARQNGIKTMLGAQVGETVILSAAGRHFATRCVGMDFVEGSYGHFLIARDIGVQDLTIGQRGMAPVLTGLGLGVAIDQPSLESLTQEKHRLEPVRC